MTEAAESGERAARAALDDAMSLNVLRVLDTLYSAGLIASPGTHGGRWPSSSRRNLGELWRQGVAEHILGASRRAHDEVRRCSQIGYAC